MERQQASRKQPARRKGTMMVTEFFFSVFMAYRLLLGECIGA
jgi:hypothetical protein